MGSFEEEWQQIMDTPIATYKQYSAKELAEYFQVSYKTATRKLAALGIKPVKTEGRKKFYSEEVLQMPELKALKHKKAKEKQEKEQQFHVFETETAKEIKTLNAKLDALAQENAILEQQIHVLESGLLEVKKVLKLLSRKVLADR